MAKVLFVETGVSRTMGSEITALRASVAGNEDAFRTALEQLWNSRTNEKDRPVEYNGSGQLPMMNFYKGGGLCQDRYLGVHELLGTELLFKASYVRGDGLLFAASIAPSQAITALNIALRGVQLALHKG